MKIGIIGGTGIGERLMNRMDPQGISHHRPDTPFGWPSAEIIEGTVRAADGSTVEVLLLNRHGVGHKIPPHRLPFRANIFALKEIGATHLIATGATGSLREQIKPGDLVLCDQVIDRTTSRSRTFFDDAAVHVEFADPFCPVMRSWLMRSSGDATTTVHEQGTYVCIEGPSFSTRAESKMHRLMGGDLVGMTAMPEARLAREAEVPMALLGLPTDYDCWRERSEGTEESSLLEEIMANLEQACESAFRLIESALCRANELVGVECPAHRALELAIWTDKGKIRGGEIDRLAPCWGRYFESGLIV
jgi:5'-methylthioadenosine phosphorylase